MKSHQAAVLVKGLIEEGEAFRRLGADLAVPTPSKQARRGRGFHIGMSVAFLVTAFAGFAPTYYLKGLSHAPALSPGLHLHGAVFTAWLLLLFAQTALVAAHRVDLHRRLGIAGAILAAMMVPLGMMTAIAGAQRGSTRPGFEPMGFMIFPFGQVVLFAIFIGAALWNRRRSELHRRLVLVATACLMTPAITRLPFVGQRPILSLGLSALFVVAGMLHDWKSRGRVHPVYVKSVLVILLSGPARFALGQTAAWQSFARFLAG